MKLSDKLIVLRKENGWSQEDFAEKLDVSRQAISRWENGTALPDAQNILRISKLFHVSADYLLNDEYESEINTENTTEEIIPSMLRKKQPHRYLIPIMLFSVLSVCVMFYIVKNINKSHTHPVLIRAIENETAPTCTEQGGYDEVLYCAECGEEVMRTHINMGMPAHQFQNEKCIVCGEDQRARD